MTAIDLDAIRDRLTALFDVEQATLTTDGTHLILQLGADTAEIERQLALVDAPALLALVDEAHAHIDAAREHLQIVIATRSYVGTRVQEEAQRALALLDGEPDGADE